MSTNQVTSSRKLRFALVAIFITIAASGLYTFRDGIQSPERSSMTAMDRAWTFVAKNYDTNSDGSITKAEYTRSAAAFDALDRNDDGVIQIDDWSVPPDRVRQNFPAPAIGDAAPQFSLKDVVDPDNLTSLSQFRDGVPVALIFGSCT